jgi:hypothetical protein
VRTALGDLNGDGKNELLAVSNYGRTAELVVFQQNVASDGTVTLVKDARYNLQPFGAAYTTADSIWPWATSPATG